MIKTMKSFVKDESGATAIEYGLIAALTAMGSSLRTMFETVSSKLDEAVSQANQ
jgi:Flp pilus assembly pilin Flp